MHKGTERIIPVEAVGAVIEYVPTLHQAFKALVSNFKGIVKTKEVAAKTYKYTHATLNDILELWEEHAGDDWLLIQQPIVRDDKTEILRTELIYLPLHNNNKIISEMLMPPNNEPRLTGAVMTYYRRYSLLALLNLKVYDNEQELEGSSSDVPETIIKEIEDAKEATELRAMWTKYKDALSRKQLKNFESRCASRVKELEQFTEGAE